MLVIRIYEQDAEESEEIGRGTIGDDGKVKFVEVGDTTQKREYLAQLYPEHVAKGIKKFAPWHLLLSSLLRSQIKPPKRDPFWPSYFRFEEPPSSNG